MKLREILKQKIEQKLREAELVSKKNPMNENKFSMFRKNSVVTVGDDTFKVSFEEDYNSDNKRIKILYLTSTTNDNVIRVTPGGDVYWQGGGPMGAGGRMGDSYYVEYSKDGGNSFKTYGEVSSLYKLDRIFKY